MPKFRKWVSPRLPEEELSGVLGCNMIIPRAVARKLLQLQYPHLNGCARNKQGPEVPGKSRAAPGKTPAGLAGLFLQLRLRLFFKLEKLVLQLPFILIL